MIKSIYSRTFNRRNHQTIKIAQQVKHSKLYLWTVKIVKHFAVSCPPCHVVFVSLAKFAETFE